MKFFVIAFAVIAAVAADVSHVVGNEYLPPLQENSLVPTNEYLPPSPSFAPVPVEPVVAHVLADDGYRYKTQRRVVYRRHRRDVSHLASNEYLPPALEESFVKDAPSDEYLAPVQQAEPVDAPVEAEAAHVLADDGYRYKTQRRVVYRRNRRDVSHLAANEYLPPAPEIVPIEVSPIEEVSNAVVEEPVAAHQLADDGYRYKTQRRVVYRRNRRDVSHLPSNEYLPPVQEASFVAEAPVLEVSNAVNDEAYPAHDLGDDGYRYKTQRRVVYRRNRRDVSHLVSNEYLPPAQETGPAAFSPLQPVAILDEAEPAHELADDGYHYKTQRRVAYRRNRRDVSHLASNEYLPPPQQDFIDAPAPTNEYLPPAQQDEPAPAHELADDGYHYKTHRRVVYRRH